MGEFIVSARKYRPATFNTVVGQGALVTTLKNAIASNHLAHAYLFCGPRGVGKTTCARIFAKTINCQNLTAEHEACNECDSCKSFIDNRSMNIHELDAASNNSVEDIRELIRQVQIPPQLGKYSVFIIDEVHMLSQAAFNAFLKTLEEPPAHAIFIMATTEKQKILPTILSRCQIYDFSRISLNDIVSHLQYVANDEGVTAEAAALNIIAQKADGGMRDALSIFDQVVSFCGNDVTYRSVIENLNVLDYEYYFKLVEHFIKGEVPQSMMLFNEILDKGFDGGQFVAGLAAHMRDVLVCKDAVTLPLLEVGADIGERYKTQAGQCDLSFLYDALRLSNDCSLDYKNSKNKRLLVEILLIRLCQLSAKKKKELTDDSDKPSKILDPLFSLPDVLSDAVRQVSSASIPQMVSSVSSSLVSESKKPSYSSRLVHTISLSRPLNPEKVQTNQGVALKRNESFNDQSLLEAWYTFVRSIPEEVHLTKTMVSCLPHIVEECKVEVVVSNEFQKNDLDRRMTDLMRSLSNSLSNDFLKLNIKVDVNRVDPHGKMPIDIFNDLKETHPAFKKLVDKFGLVLR